MVKMPWAVVPCPQGLLSTGWCGAAGRDGHTQLPAASTACRQTGCWGEGLLKRAPDLRELLREADPGSRVREAPVPAAGGCCPPAPSQHSLPPLGGASSCQSCPPAEAHSPPPQGLVSVPAQEVPQAATRTPAAEWLGAVTRGEGLCHSQDRVTQPGRPPSGTCPAAVIPNVYTPALPCNETPRRWPGTRCPSRSLLLWPSCHPW